MADLENRVDKLEGRVSSIEVTVEKLSQKVDDFIAESRRNADRQDADMREMRTEMQNLSNKIDSTVRGMFFTVALGIAAMVITVLLK